MRHAALLVLLAVLCAAGCGEIKKEIDKPGPAPPYNPKGAALPPAAMPKEPTAAGDEAPKDEAEEPADDQPVEKAK